MASDDQSACQQLLAHPLVFKSCLNLLCRNCQENYESGINIFVLFLVSEHTCVCTLASGQIDHLVQFERVQY